MNMIVNKSDLVGYEAVDRTEAKKKALAKLVSAWESKQARNAKRFGGLGFLAVSLAACNSSSDDTAAVVETPAETTPTVTALTQALAATADVITSTFTSADDNITAVDTGTAATTTFGAGDVLVDSSSTDNDTLTVTMSGAAGATVAAPSTVTGIENIIYNYDGIVTATNSTVDAANIIGANITVNHTGNSAVAPTGSTVSNIGANNTVTFGTNIVGTARADVGASATGVTINGGAAAILDVNSGASADGVTINGGTSAALDVDLGATNKNITITGGSAAGAENVLVSSATGVSITTGAATTGLTVGDVASNVSITYTVVGTATAKGAIDVEGTAAATDTATITAAGTHTLETRDTGQQVEVLSLSGNGAAATYELNATNDLPTTLTFTGSQSVTFAVTEAQAVGLTTVTDSTTAGTTTIKVAALTANRDLKALTSDVIDLNGAITGAVELIFKDGSTVDITTAQTNAFEVDVDDGATANSTTGTLTVNVTKDITTLNVDSANDVVQTLTVVNSGSTNAAPHTYNVVDMAGTEAMTINMSGTAATLAATTEALHLNGAGMTGALKATVDADLLKITGGSGNDEITGIATVVGVLDGGAGNDTFITAVGDMSNTTLANFEVIDITAGNAAFKASTLTGQSYIIKNDDGTDQLQINAAAMVNESNIDLSGLSFSNSADVVVTLTNFDGTKFTSGQTFTVKGTTQDDTLTGSANADTLQGEAGADIIVGAAGADIISGGEGADAITGGTGIDVIDGGAGVDTITIRVETTAGDIITGGAGNDIITTDTTGAATAGVTKVTDMDLGTSSTQADVLKISIQVVEALTTTTDLVDTGANTAANTNNTVTRMTADAQTVAAADLVVLAGTYANDAAALAGMKTAGSDTITYGAALTDNDSFLVAYTDGTSTYVAAATAGAANLTTSEGLDSVATLVELTGVSDLTLWDDGDYVTIT
ncbi:MAG: hypothetical protein P8L82_02845 [Paracoccaceae bacterium]|nr:hypothetical protein [Paracoccaceae bacterium]